MEPTSLNSQRGQAHQHSMLCIQPTCQSQDCTVGFCDASSKAYAAVVYFRLEYEDSVDVKFLAAKTRVAPIHGSMIPRLELSALLLSKLLTRVKDALQSEQSLADPVCFTDSKASLYWNKGSTKNGSSLWKTVYLRTFGDTAQEGKTRLTFPLKG